MSDKTDHTPAICAALNYHQPDRLCRDKDTERFVHSGEYLYPVIKVSLLDGSLQADGLAVRLVEMVRAEGLLMNPECIPILKDGKFTDELYWCLATYGADEYVAVQKTLAHAVHDALVEALGIEEASDD